MVNLFKTLVGKLFTGVFLGAAMIGGGIYYSMTKKENPGEKFKKPPHVIEILNEEHSIPLYNTSTNKHEEDTSLRITAELDKEKNIIYFGNYTKDYNKKDWSKLEERIPVYKRHMQLNSENSTIIIFHPPEVEITKQEQRIFTVSQYSWVADLKPYEEHEEAQMMIEGGEEIIDWALNKLIPGLPFKKFIEYMREEKRERYEEMIDELSDRISDGKYSGTLILPQIPAKIIGYTETARESKIYFNTNEVKGEIPIYLWANIALGNQTIDYQSPNKYGGLENVLIEFSLRGGKEAVKEEVAKEERIRKEEVVEKPKTLEDYFLKGKELEGISLAHMAGMRRHFGNVRSNPYFLTEEEIIKEFKNVDLEYPSKFGIATYAIEDKEGEYFALLYTTLLQFNSKLNAQNFVKFLEEERNLERNLLPVIFLKNKIFAGMEFEICTTKKQMNLIIINCLRNYTERINPDFIYMIDKKINKKEFIPNLKEELNKIIR